MSDGVFYDGKSAKRLAVHVSIVGEELLIRDESQHTLAQWPIAQLEVSIEDTDTGSLRIVHTSDRVPTLIATAPALTRRIREVLPRKPARRYGHNFTLSHALAIVATTLCVGALIYFTLPQLTRPIAALVPIEWEKSLGENILRSIPGAENKCQRPDGTAVLAALTTRLSSVMALPYPVSVSVAELAIENAFATPGGFIVIGNNLLAEMESPDEFAAVLAHEMAHIAERHPMSRAVRVLGITLVFDLVAGGGSGLSETLIQGAGLLLLLSHSRDDERAADEIGIEALEKAGIHPGGLSAFFTRLETKFGNLEDSAVGGLMTWLGTHPSFSERKSSAAQKITKSSLPRALSDTEWAALRAICKP